MGQSSQRHGREIYGRDTANQIDVPGTGGGYGGGALRATPDGVSGLPSAWPPPGSFAVAYADATTSTMTWVEPVDPGDGSTMWGKLIYRDGTLISKANLSSPQTDPGPLVAGRTYNYTIYTWDDRGRISAASEFQYTHQP